MTKLTAVLAVPLALLATVASLGIVLVDVREGDGTRIVVPVPLVLAQAALALCPVNALPLAEHQEALAHAGVAREVLEALAEAPDGELVRVEEPGEEVVVTKDGRFLRVHVKSMRGKGEDVSVNVPLRLALRALPDSRGRISTLALAGALGGVRFTDLVEVRDGDEHVRVRVF
jgi:hypothetical protein